jgi:maltokinase
MNMNVAMGTVSSVIAGASRELAGRLLGETFHEETAITADQTNESVVVDGRVVVKWLRPPVAVPHPGVDVIRHLGRRGFTEMPALLGVEEDDGTVVAILTEYLPGAVDGWDWFVDDVVAWLDGNVPIEHLVSSARSLGAITARLHLALTDLHPADVDLTPIAARALTDLALAVDRLDQLDWLDRDVVTNSLDPLRGNRVRGHRIHGDLHAGQFLRAGDTMLLTDFDGNPLVDSTDRVLPQSPLRDVASLLQSIVHVGAVVVKRHRPQRAVDVDLFVERAVSAALTEYRSSFAVDDEVLRALRVAQELHEYAYAIHHLPHWRYVADDALPRLLAAT